MAADDGPIAGDTPPGHIQSLDGRPMSENPVMNDNDMKLGLFSLTNSNGGCLSYAETGFEPSIEHTAKIARRADEYGLEMLTPVGRWVGFGGDIDFGGQKMETLTWASAIARETEYPAIMATVHTGVFHPIVAANQAMTIDHASDGRFVLNIVSGWFAPEMGLFDVDGQLEHSKRYQRTEEWTELLKKLWTEQGFEYHGEFYDIEKDPELESELPGFQSGGYMKPKPLQQPRPPIMNAGQSDDGRNFATKHADVSFIHLEDLEQGAEVVEDIRQRTADHGRDPDDIQIMTTGYCSVANTEAEAQARLDEVTEKGDYQAVENMMNMMIGEEGMQSISEEQLENMEESWVSGWGGHKLVGTPEQIVDELVELNKIGIDGYLFTFLDYYEELEYFGEEVIPLMEAEGLRSERRGEPV